jgi:transcriptional regulator with AAA-type ATPase domain
LKEISRVFLSDSHRFPTAMIRGLTAWERSGNIRELENFIEPAVIVTRSKSLEAPLGNSAKRISLLTNMKKGSAMRVTLVEEIGRGSTVFRVLREAVRIFL